MSLNSDFDATAGYVDNSREEETRFMDRIIKVLGSRELRREINLFRVEFKTVTFLFLSSYKLCPLEYR